jgi:hypothetical protein
MVKTGMFFVFKHTQYVVYPEMTLMITFFRRGGRVWK